MPHTRWFIAPTLAVLLSAIALAAFSALNIDWAAWRPATCLPNACFCEAIGAGPIRQPINTWSNLAFVWVGAFIAFSATPDRPLRRSYTLILALACVGIGLGSWLYHASLSFVGQWLDVMSMYLLGVFMVLYAARRLKVTRSFPRAVSGNPAARPALIANRRAGCPTKAFGHDRINPASKDDRIFAIWYIAINGALGVLLIAWPDARRYLFGILIASALILEAILHRRKQTTLQAKWPIGALGVYVAAQAIWTLDLNHIVCDPTSVLQGHAVWHVLTAASAGLLYGYYQSEVNHGQPHDTSLRQADSPG
ncbi:MAG: ceramidase domain-containing protein [Chloroflexi bacterium]|nr:ceramidase domain-containing protein [Chloroflexota bacterium]